MIRTLWIGKNDLPLIDLEKFRDAEGSKNAAFQRSDQLSEGLKVLTDKNSKAIDVVLLDLDHQEGSGLDSFLKVHGSAPETPLIVVVNRDDRALALKAVEKGAWDYLLRDDVSGAMLMKAIEHVWEKKRLISDIAGVRKEKDECAKERTREIERIHSDLKQQLEEQRQISDELTRSENRYRTIVEEITYLIYYTTDVNGYATYVNQPCAEITGYTVDELMGMHYLDLIHPDWREKAQALYHDQFINRIEETTMDFPINTKDGEVRWVEQKVRLFSSDGYVHGFQGIARDITDQKKAEDKLRTALKEKEILLKEVHHRMKNNLLAISGLLHFQEAFVKDEDARKVLANCQRRIMSMAVIHEKLYQMDDLANVNIGDYILTLANHLVKSFSESPDNVTIKVPVSDIRLNVETAVPCGLIITELITNALEYAFSVTGRGTITVDLRELPGRKFILTVSDDGIGLPEDLDIGKSKSLGLLLTRTLIDSLGGKMEIDRKNGSTFRIEFAEYSEGRVEPIADLSPPD